MGIKHLVKITNTTSLLFLVWGLFSQSLIGFIYVIATSNHYPFLFLQQAYIYPSTESFVIATLTTTFTHIHYMYVHNSL